MINIKTLSNNNVILNKLLKIKNKARKLKSTYIYKLSMLYLNIQLEINKDFKDVNRIETLSNQYDKDLIEFRQKFKNLLYCTKRELNSINLDLVIIN